ncbi:MAG: twin-arginine translocase subunit TatC, partial [Planctomycetota bacterium]|nr:twin-arginine translocase subunit TatC [Planctomycetota bacterium]
TLNASYAEVIWDISKVFSMTLVMSFAFGVIFQLPLVIILVSLLNLVHPNTLARHRRITWIACFILAAFLTPPDPISQSMMAVPTILLFELGIWLARIFLRKRLKAMEEEDRWDDDHEDDQDHDDHGEHDGDAEEPEVPIDEGSDEPDAAEAESASENPEEPPHEKHDDDASASDESDDETRESEGEDMDDSPDEDSDKPETSDS